MYQIPEEIKWYFGRWRYISHLGCFVWGQLHTANRSCKTFIDTCHESNTRWWQLKYFWNFHGEMIQSDERNRAYFSMGLDSTKRGWFNAIPCIPHTHPRVQIPAIRIGGSPKPVVKTLQLNYSINTKIWSNYSDLTRPHPKWWFSKGNSLISGKSRLVKYNNLARINTKMQMIISWCTISLVSCFFSIQDEYQDEYQQNILTESTKTNWCFFFNVAFFGRRTTLQVRQWHLPIFLSLSWNPEGGWDGGILKDIAEWVPGHLQIFLWAWKFHKENPSFRWLNVGHLEDILGFGIPIYEPGIKDVQAFVYPKFHLANTLPETNIAPENRPLEKEIPIGNHHFQGLC